MARVTNELDAHIGKVLRGARMAADLTQGGLATRLDISFQQVQKYENGTNRVSAARLYHICQILDMPMARFYEGYGELPTAEPLYSRNVYSAARALGDIPEGPPKDKLLGLIRVMAGHSADIIDNETTELKVVGA